MSTSPVAFICAPTTFTSFPALIFIVEFEFNSLPFDVLDFSVSLDSEYPTKPIDFESVFELIVSFPSSIFTFSPALIFIPSPSAITVLPFIVVDLPEFISTPPAPPIVLPFEVELVFSVVVLPLVTPDWCSTVF